MRIRTYLQSHKKLFLVGLTFVLLYMGNGAYNPYVSLFHKSIGLSTSQIGIITAIGPIATLVFQTAWGRLADRTNRKLVLCLAFVTSCICASLYLLGTSFLYMLVVSVTFVIFNMSVLPMSDALGLDFCSKNGYRFAPIRMCGTIGFTLPAIFLGRLFDKDLRYCFYVYILITMLAAVSTLFFPMGKQEKAPLLADGKRQKTSMAPLLKDPLVIFLLLANFVLAIGVSTYTYQPLYASSLGYDNAQCGLLSSIAAASEIPTLLLIDRIMKKIDPKKIVVFSVFMMAVRLGISYAAGFTGKAAFGVLSCAGLLQSVTYMTNYYCSAHLIHNRFPAELKSSAQTLLALVSSGLSRILANLAAGWLSEPEVLGLQNTFLFFSLFVLAGSFAVFFCYRRLSRTKSAVHP